VNEGKCNGQARFGPNLVSRDMVFWCSGEGQGHLVLTNKGRCPVCLSKNVDEPRFPSVQALHHQDTPGAHGIACIGHSCWFSTALCTYIPANVTRMQSFKRSTSDELIDTVQ